jgi:hypothetical protein
LRREPIEKQKALLAKSVGLTVRLGDGEWRLKEIARVIEVAQFRNIAAGHAHLAAMGELASAA